jgi:antitoxin VapB
MGEAKAKIFWSGRSQAVRLPKEFRFEDGIGEVTIRRQGRTLVLELPANEASDDWSWLDKLSGTVDPEFEAAVEENPGEPTPRPEIDEFFK